MKIVVQYSTVESGYGVASSSISWCLKRLAWITVQCDINAKKYEKNLFSDSSVSWPKKAKENFKPSSQLMCKESRKHIDYLLLYWHCSQNIGSNLQMVDVSGVCVCSCR